MDEGTPRRTAVNRRSSDERPRGWLVDRPDRIAFWALCLALLAMVAAATSAHAGSGGVSATGTGGTSAGSGSGRYTRIWDHLRPGEHRWAHRTSQCESGQDPRAIGGNGAYRGAFQFTRPTWKSAPKSPGGDPIRYAWRTQAVVAVLLKHHLGTKPWPVCGSKHH
jgi:transglycosylase-like protein